MRRPLGVSLSAVFLAVAAVLGFFMTIVFVQVASRANIKSPPSTHVLAAAPIVACGATTIYAICVFAGLLRGRNWARLGGIVFGAVLIIFAILLLFITNTIFVMPQLERTATLNPGTLVAVLSYLVMAGIGVWLTIYLNIGSVKRVFAGNKSVDPELE